ncbi:MAG: cytochrome c oxidase accessory protein FixG [Parasphingorhabdus sp.]|jgi:cytochrome c oxidase accessory protein FixG
MDNTDNSLKQSLYAKRETIHPRHVTGIFAALRVTAVVILMGIYYGLPWIQWDGRQAVLFDLPARKFYLFGITLWPQDFIYLAALLIVAALSLFFFTAIAGRLWCGFACPQTVWTEVFMWIERKVEGDRNQRIKLDKSPTNKHKVFLKIVKHGIWVILSVWTGYTFVGYFTPIIELGHKIVVLQTGPWETFWVLFYGFATYGNAGWMREQVCLYMCPYARFQSAMFDKNTLVISYDPARGEPRGHRKRSEDTKAVGLGSCIDCKLCVQVCPTGIDIRDGLQYQCIGCAACIDACDDVMEKMSYPKGLIRYTTENALASGATKLFRPKVILYALILVAISGALIYGLVTRDAVGLDVIRDRNVLYRVTNEGLAENIYTLKLLNKDNYDHIFHVAVTGLPGIKLREEKEVFVTSGYVEEAIIAILVDPVDMKFPSADIEIQITAKNNPELKAMAKARYLKPR